MTPAHQRLLDFLAELIVDDIERETPPAAGVDATPAEVQDSAA